MTLPGLTLRNAFLRNKTRSFLTILGVVLSAVAFLFLRTILTAWYASGFSPDLSGTGADLFAGRYTIVFPALLVLLSFLIVTPINLRSLAQAKTVAIILLLAVPVVINEVGKRNTLLGLGGSLILTILAAVMLSWQSDKPSDLSPAR